jgi:hypothetical protein
MAPDLVSQRSDHRDRQPGRLVFGNRQPGRLVFGLPRIGATDTSNPNQQVHTRQHQMHILHKLSVRLGMDSDSPSTD